MESREGREWVDGWVRGVEEPWDVIRKLHERNHQVRNGRSSGRDIEPTNTFSVALGSRRSSLDLSAGSCRTIASK